MDKDNIEHAFKMRVNPPDRLQSKFGFPASERALSIALQYYGFDSFLNHPKQRPDTISDIKALQNMIIDGLDLIQKHDPSVIRKKPVFLGKVYMLDVKTKQKYHFNSLLECSSVMDIPMSELKSSLKSILTENYVLFQNKFKLVAHEKIIIKKTSKSKGKQVC